MSHTKEPWRLGKLTHPRDYETVRETVGPHDVVVDTDDGVYVLAFCNYNFPQDALANARRIVACVNACAGISTESMEVGGVGSIFSLGLEEQRRGDVAEQQRDALLAAIERTLAEEGHLADGEVCTLLALKVALRESGAPWAGDELRNAKG